MKASWSQRLQMRWSDPPGKGSLYQQERKTGRVLPRKRAPWSVNAPLRFPAATPAPSLFNTFIFISKKGKSLFCFGLVSIRPLR